MRQPNRIRRTKIIATVGPSSNSQIELEKLIRAGVDIFRINMSHGKKQEHAKIINSIRFLANKRNKNIAILIDLQGPKIRITKFFNGSVNLKAGDEFCINSDLDSVFGSSKEVGVTYKKFALDVKVGDTLLLDDGRLVAVVNQIVGNKVITKISVGGKLANNKGINLLGGGLSIDSITKKDISDIKFAKEYEVDYLAISFSKFAKDIEDCRKIANSIGLETGIVAKIERAETVADETTLDAIIKAADVLMVARGDLGVEIGDAKLPAIQKDIIYRARLNNKAVITATQMMETMITNPIPTRAEVFDVANAVIDGTDAVMLSGETAVGVNPANVVSAMADICFEAETQRNNLQIDFRKGVVFQEIDEMIAMAAMYSVNHSNIKCVVCLTVSGKTALLMSRISSGKPIIVLSEISKTRRKVAMYRGVYSDLLTDIVIKNTTSDVLVKTITSELKKNKIVSQGDKILITRGAIYGKIGGTSKMEVIEIS